MTDYSISPAGEKFAIPEEDEYAAEFERIAFHWLEERQQVAQHDPPKGDHGQICSSSQLSANMAKSLKLIKLSAYKSAGDKSS